MKITSRQLSVGGTPTHISWKKTPKTGLILIITSLRTLKKILIGAGSGASDRGFAQSAQAFDLTHNTRKINAFYALIFSTVAIKKT